MTMFKRMQLVPTDPASAILKDPVVKQLEKADNNLAESLAKPATDYEKARDYWEMLQQFMGIYNTIKGTSPVASDPPPKPAPLKAPPLVTPAPQPKVGRLVEPKKIKRVRKRPAPYDASLQKRLILSSDEDTPIKHRLRKKRSRATQWIPLPV